MCLAPMMNNERVSPVDRDIVSDIPSLLVGWSDIQKQRVPDLLCRRQEEVSRIYKWYCAQGAVDEQLRARCHLQSSS